MNSGFARIGESQSGDLQGPGSTKEHRIHTFLSVPQNSLVTFEALSVVWVDLIVFGSTLVGGRREVGGGCSV